MVSYFLNAWRHRTATLVVLGTLGAGGSLAAYAQPRADSLAVRLEGTAGAERLAVLADATYKDDPERAVMYGREALALFTRHPGLTVERHVLFRIGQALDHLGDGDAVLGMASRLDALGDHVADGHSAVLRGRVHRSHSDYDADLTPFERALEHYSEAGDAPGQAVAHNNLGSILRRQDRSDEARAHYERALAINEELGDQAAIAGGSTASPC